MFISGLKPKRLQKTKVATSKVARVMESSLTEDVPSQVMDISAQSNASHGLANDLDTVDNSDEWRDKDQLESKNDKSLISDDKVFQAVKFLEQLKSYLEFDNQEEMESQDELDSANVSHSVQVSEVTSSNINGVTDGSGGLETDIQADWFEDKANIAINGTNELQQTVCHNADSVTKEGGIFNDKGFHSVSMKTKRTNSVEGHFNAKKMRLMESMQSTGDPSRAKKRFQKHSKNNLLPMNKFSCSLCKSSFMSYSQLKRHKRVIHKLYSKAVESNGSKNSTVRKLHSYQCDLCLQRIDTIKNLRQHLRTTHNVTRKSPKILLQSARIKNLDTDSLLSHNIMDLKDKYIVMKSGQLECSLCGAVFLTYRGHTGHLQRRHNVFISQPNGNKQKKLVTKSNERKCENQGLGKGYSQSNGKEPERGQLSGESDTNMKCKKCELSFDSVKERREHELKSHGLKVCFGGEQFVFMEIDMKIRKADAVSSHTVGGQKNPVIDTEEQFFCKKTNGCKLCSAKYEIFSSLQRHMHRTHDIRVYKQVPSVYKTNIKQETLPANTEINTRIPGKTVSKALMSGVSTCTNEKGLVSQKAKPLSISSHSVEVGGSKLQTPLSKVTPKELEILSKKMGASPHKLLIYRLEGVGNLLKGSSNAKLFLVKLKANVAGKKSATGTLSAKTEMVKLTEMHGEKVKSLPNEASQMPYKIVTLNGKTVLSNNKDMPLEKAIALLNNGTRTSSKGSASSNRGKTSNCKGMTSSDKLEKSFEKPLNKAKVLSVGSETVSKTAEGVVIKEGKGQDKDLEKSLKTSQPVADENEIDKLLWSTSFARKRFSCLICNVSFSGYNIQRKHMLTSHDIHLDNHGNRVKTVPSASQSGGREGGDKSLTKGQNGETVHAASSANNSKLLQISSCQRNIGDPGCDNSQSSLLCEDDNGMEDEKSYEMITQEDGEKVYLCSHCPSRFKSLIDRLIHIKDVHKNITAQVHDDIERSQSSSFTAKNTGVPAKKANSPRLKSVVQSLTKVDDVVKGATVKKSQIKQQAQSETDPPPQKKRNGDPPGIFRCHLCDHIYRYYRGVYRHIQKHHNAKPLGRSMYQERKSSGNKVLVENPRCPFCQRTFRAFNYLTTHMKCEHSAEMGNGTALGHLDENSSTLQYSDSNEEKDMAKMSKGDLAFKQNRQFETVRSNLLAISISDEPISDNDYQCIKNNSISGEEQDYTPVPPCDESEFVTEGAQIIEDNLFSRLQANLFANLPQAVKKDDSTSLHHIVTNFDNNRGSKNKNSNQRAGPMNNCVPAFDDAQTSSFSKGKVQVFSRFFSHGRVTVKVLVVELLCVMLLFCYPLLPLAYLSPSSLSPRPS